MPGFLTELSLEGFTDHDMALSRPVRIISNEQTDCPGLGLNRRPTRSPASHLDDSAITFTPLIKNINPRNLSIVTVLGQTNEPFQ